jgi:hypothetical protein
MPMNGTDINVMRVTWTGFLGGPGVSTHYFDGGSIPPVAAVRTFYNALAGTMPSKVSIQVPNSGEAIQSSDGVLIGSWASGSLPAAVQGGLTGATLAAVGYQIDWTTDEIADGRAVKGRTFFVPTGSQIWDPDGILVVGNQTTIKAAADALVGASPKMAVWHRPKFGPKPTGGGARPVLREGSWAPVTGSAVPRKSVVLTSRRD